MQNMMDMMPLMSWGMAAILLLVVVSLVLAIAALVKFLVSGKGR